SNNLTSSRGILTIELPAYREKFISNLRREMDGGNHYNKYESKNPIERRLVDGFLCTLKALADRTHANRIHEVGCGEGMLIKTLARPNRQLLGSDESAEVIREAASRHAD